MSSAEQLRAVSARVGPGVPVGVTEDMVHALVHGFYDKIRADEALGPIFARVIGDDWRPHLAKMCDFWSSVVLMTGRYKGQPVLAHAGMSELGPAHFARWLQLFREAAGAICPPKPAALFIARAEMIAESLQLGIAVSRGELPPAARPCWAANS